MITAGYDDESTAVGSDDDPQPTGLVPALTIVSHPLAHRVGDRLVLDAVMAGGTLRVSRKEGDFTRPGHRLGLPLGDRFVSRRPIWFAATGDGGIRITVDRHGTAVIAGAPVRDAVTCSAEELVHGVALELADRIVLVLHLFDRELGETGDALGMVGNSAGIRRVRTAIERVVDLPVPVLIRGETGTGKELVARAIHDRGPRRGGPFLSVNLGAIPRELAAAELFGAVRGAYTGATRDREGLFRAAQGGTLFLDEVGEAPPEVQVMLLRVLETGELYPVGAETPSATDVRLIAATDANLEDQIREGRFKAPLLHRLSGYEVRLPPLRERREDLGVLFYHFARAELAAIGELHRLAPRDPDARSWLPAQLAAQLVRYGWPGNIRQLRNLTRQMVIESRGQAQLRIDPRVLDALATTESALRNPQLGTPLAVGSGQRRKPSAVTESELLAALRTCAWDLTAAADRLRIPRPSIYDLISKHPKLRTAGDLDSDEIVRCFEACDGDLDAMAVRLEVSRHALSRRTRELGLVAAALSTATDASS
ncbi:MAG: sigma-54 dependent transcriptional regulator [Kofleriaceae bacterium]